MKGEEYMNVYKVIVCPEKSPTCDVWQIEATVVSVAIRRGLNKSKQNKAKEVSVSCELLTRNITLKEYKEKHP